MWLSTKEETKSDPRKTKKQKLNIISRKNVEQNSFNKQGKMNDIMEEDDQCNLNNEHTTKDNWNKLIAKTKRSNGILRIKREKIYKIGLMNKEKDNAYMINIIKGLQRRRKTRWSLKNSFLLKNEGQKKRITIYKEKKNEKRYQALKKSIINFLKMMNSQK